MHKTHPMAPRICLILLVALTGTLRIHAQPQLCLLNDGQIGGYSGFDSDPFASWNCMAHIGTDTTVWKVWPGAVDEYEEWYDACPIDLMPNVAMLETAIPYPVAVQDTFTIKHICNTFDAQYLAERLVIANTNELAGLPDQVLDGTEKWLLTIMYHHICHELDTLADLVTTRISVDRGATWINASDPADPFRTEATGAVCAGWYDWEVDQSEVAPLQWTGTGYAWRSRHVFDLLQGYRASWPHFTDPADYLAAWNVNAVDTVIQQFVLHSDDMHSGKRGWRLPRMFVTSFHVRDSGLGLDPTAPASIEWPEVRYGPLPVLHLPTGAATGRLNVFDAVGRVVQTDIVGPSQDTPLVPGAASGYYIMRLSSLNGRQWSTSFINP